MRCQDWYDAGNEPIGEEIVYRWRDGQPMKKGANGFHINCAHCRKEFESLGLALLLDRLRASYVNGRQSSGHGQAGIEPSARRQCEEC